MGPGIDILSSLLPMSMVSLPAFVVVTHHERTVNTAAMEAILQGMWPNRRLGRMLATLMALQAGLPILDFSDWDGEKRETYFAAIRAGLDRDYVPMQKLFAGIIETSPQTA